MQTCKTCKYWIPPQQRDYGAKWGRCEEIINGELADIDLSDYDWEIDISIECCEDFGCVLWEAK